MYGVVAELNTNLINKQTMKRIKLTHGSARVSDNITEETKQAINKMIELAYNHGTKQCAIQSVSDSCFKVRSVDLVIDGQKINNEVRFIIKDQKNIVDFTLSENQVEMLKSWLNYR